jgi:hypothetical protein
LLYSVLFNWLGAGFIVATMGREVANRHLTDHKSSSHVRQSVEWLYAFDIHCNAFFPVFVLLCKYGNDDMIFLYTTVTANLKLFFGPRLTWIPAIAS